MKRPQFLFQKILAFLRIRSIVAGLDISDQVLRLVYFAGSVWQLSAVRLEPGILENGKIKDRDKFFAALVTLKIQSKIGDVKKKTGVVISLSSVNAYSQVFSLPTMANKELVKAVELNLQIASPGEAGKTYAGWQIVGKNEDKSQFDVLSSFIDREIVDDIVQVLFDANFFVMAIEPRSIALSRILREKGLNGDAKQSYILIDVSVAGVDFFVIRNGEPYFEYPTGWTDIADEKGNISMDKFISQLLASLRQILNFYTAHWPEPIAGVIISTVTFQDEIEKTIAQNFSFPILRMTLEMGQIISPEWLIAVGCALRDRQEKFEFGKRELTLLAEPWEDRFQGEQLLRFLSFWRVLVPIVMGGLVLAFVVTEGYLTSTAVSIAAEVNAAGSTSEVQQLSALEASSTQFNSLVSNIQNVEQRPQQIHVILADVISLATTSQITINNLSFPAGGAAVTLSGSASSEDRIIAFKTALENDANITGVNLSLAQIQQNGTNFTFTVTFSYK